MTDPPIITQTLGVRASPLLHSSQRRWASVGGTYDNKLFKAAPLKSMDAGLQQSNALYATGMNEKEIESADL